jgi:predicted O-methyltransferase YrrM
MSARAAQAMTVEDVAAAVAGDGRSTPVERILADHPATSGYAISNGTVRAVAGLVSAGFVRSVLEIGAGRSSIVIAEALASQGGGRLTSVDNAPQFCADTWALVRAVQGVDARLVTGPLRLRIRDTGVHYWFSVHSRSLADRAPFDLVLIDAPHKSYGREASLHLAYPHLADRAVIVLDDATRSAEKRIIRRWLDRYPGLQLVHTSDQEKNGFAVFYVNGQKRRRVRPRAWLETVGERWHFRRKLKAQRALERQAPDE